MSRNVNSRFALNPTDIYIQRSRFTRPSSVKLTGNVGELIPFYVDEVLPGDTFSIDTSKVVRLQTPVTPFMDNLYLDTYWYFVPNRLCWEHWKELMGENTESAWIPTTEYTVPQVSAPVDGWSIGSLADYMGIPTGVDNFSVSALPFRAYARIVDDWFRDQNLQDPVNIPVNDSDIVGNNGDNYITDLVKGGKPFIAAKFHDYYTSALPAPQKGPSVALPIGEGNFPVVPGEEHDKSMFGSTPMSLSFYDPSTGAWANKITGSRAWSIGTVDADINSGVSPDFGSYSWAGHNFHSGQGASAGAYNGYFTNLWATSAGAATSAITINELRTAFQIQRLYEADSRGGSRYTEQLRTHFGVISPDSRLQRSEYLGGNRIPINVNQVIQNSETGTTPQGTTAAYSMTTDSHSDFTKSFTEHGWVIGLMVARYDHTYQQGLDRMWTRRTRFDFYWPTLANLGEQAVLNKEIYLQGSDVVDDAGDSIDDQVFGYQERWAEYRYKPSRVCGEMRSQAVASLDVWHLGDYYTSLPHLSANWIREDKNNVDRVLTVTSEVSNQFFADIYVENNTTRPMPMYSIPGMMDHN